MKEEDRTLLVLMAKGRGGGVKRGKKLRILGASKNEYFVLEPLLG